MTFEYDTYAPKPVPISVKDDHDRAAAPVASDHGQAAYRTNANGRASAVRRDHEHIIAVWRGRRCASIPA